MDLKGDGCNAMRRQTDREQGRKQSRAEQWGATKQRSGPFTTPPTNLILGKHLEHVRDALASFSWNRNVIEHRWASDVDGALRPHTESHEKQQQQGSPQTIQSNAMNG